MKRIVIAVSWTLVLMWAGAYLALYAGVDPAFTTALAIGIAVALVLDARGLTASVARALRPSPRLEPQREPLLRG